MCKCLLNSEEDMKHLHMIPSIDILNESYTVGVIALQWLNIRSIDYYLKSVLVKAIGTFLKCWMICELSKCHPLHVVISYKSKVASFVIISFKRT